MFSMAAAVTISHLCVIEGVWPAKWNVSQRIYSPARRSRSNDSRPNVAGIIKRRRTLAKIKSMPLNKYI